MNNKRCAFLMSSGDVCEDKIITDVLKKYTWWQIIVKSFNYVRSYF